MIGYNKWNYRPYIPYNKHKDNFFKPYISRIAPASTSISGEWFDNCFSGKHKLYYSLRNMNSYSEIPLYKNTFIIEGLFSDSEYEFFIEGENGKRSNLRFARTGFVPGIVVNYLHPDDNQYNFSGQYLCSPSIVKVSDSCLIASCDIYRSKGPQNLSIIFRSDDFGKTWRYINELFPCFWGKVFMHKDALYMFSTSTEYGDLLIGKSDDLGESWSTPTVILRGGSNPSVDGFHKAPMPISLINGRLRTAVEYGCWPNKHYSNGVLSIDENADLLNAENWTLTELIPFDKNWPGANQERLAAIEGNIIKRPDGSIVEMLRYIKNKALLLKLSLDDPEKSPEFIKFIDFPLGHTKFEILNKAGGGYYACGNRLPRRNILSIYQSEDLEKWEFVKDLINYENLNDEKTAFQYPSTFIAGNKLIVLSRTAFNEPANFHDSNYITFHIFTL